MATVGGNSDMVWSASEPEAEREGDGLSDGRAITTPMCIAAAAAAAIGIDGPAVVASCSVEAMSHIAAR